LRPGILVIGHGSREAVWVERVEAAVREAAFLLRERTGAEVPVEAAYLELVEGRLIQDGVDRLEALGVTDLLAVPFFISSGSMHVREIGWALGACDEPEGGTDLKPVRVGARLSYGRPMDDDPEIAEALLDKIAPFSADPAGEAVLLIGHGNAEPELCRAWMRGMSGLAERVREHGGYAAADVALLATDDPAEKAEALRRGRPHLRVLAVPVFLSEGYFTAEAVPKRLRGAPCDYAETALLPHPKLAEWIARQSAEWLARLERSGQPG